jgi:hypothetical protein
MVSGKNHWRSRGNCTTVTLSIPIHKVFLSILSTTFRTTQKKKNTYSTKEVKKKKIKINLDFIFNNFPVYRTGLRLVIIYIQRTIGIYSLLDIKTQNTEFKLRAIHLDRLFDIS